MLTDDDLTRQLADAFRDEVGEMTYYGVLPRPRTRPAWAAPGLVALPAAGAVAAAVLVVGSTDRPTPPPPAPSAAPSPSRSAAPPAPATVTEEIALAGMTFSYERGSDDVPLDDQFLRVYEPAQLPTWAQPVELERGASAQVWVGQDPATGSVSLFVESPDRWGGRLTGLASPTITVEQMESIARTGTMS
ncbi:hypothetical protein GCM10023339_23860 [Alloalcanivorax gelatiniphagus]